MGDITTRWLKELATEPHFSVFPHMEDLRLPYRMDERDSYYHISLDVPGVDPKSIQVKSTGRTLSINSKNEDKSGAHRSVSISFTIPSCVDTSKIEANVENGVMDIILPKTTTAQVKEIPVRFVETPSFLDKVKKQLNKDKH